MAVEAPLSKHKKNSLKIFMVLLIGFAMWFTYDGYFSTRFQEKYTSSEGVPDSTLVFNRQAPFYMVGAAIFLTAYFWLIKDKKVIAAENELLLSGGGKIAYDSIEQIDKTYFESKGYFVVTYKDSTGREAKCRLSDRSYDNLSAVLDELVAKIS